LPENLLESELFGHVRGAFTGAVQGRIGRFEQAQGGTLLLDEIGELELSLQAKLLRVLEEGAFRRVGGLKDIPLDVRVLAASNRDLRTESEAGRFRLDLYYRLSIIQIDIPPLRDRDDDVLLLSQYYIDTIGARIRRRKKIKGLSAEARAVFKKYHWPGNVRELRNAVVQAAIMADDGTIEVKHLPFLIRTAPAATKPLTLEGMEREMILRVMTEMDGAQQRTADSLGISLRTLGRKLKQYQGAAGPTNTPE